MYKINYGSFPHAALRPFDATPRITLENAAAVCKLVDQLRKLKPKAGFDSAPAICVGVFQGPQVKWLVNNAEATETIERLTAAIAKAKQKE